MYENKKTKILCTIGPSSEAVSTLRKMHSLGMNAARINTAHGTFKEYKSIIDNVRKVADMPIVLDIKGPELRIRCKDKVLVPKGGNIHIGFSGAYEMHLNHNILADISKGDRLIFTDGKYAFSIVSKHDDHIVARALDNAMIEPNKNANVPGRSLKLPSLSEKDLESIEFAKKLRLEYIALSFCRSRQDILNLKRRLGNSGIKIISKVENQEGIDNISEIVDESDGVMVARGDLGVEVPIQDVPLLQKKIIAECIKKGKLVIVATQMLESMIANPTPTRAEVSDIANAILDGADCIMLSGESANGRYPIEAVECMSKVAVDVEPQVKINLPACDSTHISDCIAQSAYSLAKQVGVTKIVCLTYSGHTAAMISRFRLDIPIIAITHSEMVKRQLKLFYSLEPVHCLADIWNSPVQKSMKYLLKEKLIALDDLILFIGGLNTRENRKTNTIQIHRVRDFMASLKK